MELELLCPAELKVICKEKNLSTSRTRGDLIQRIKDSSKSAKNYGDWTLKLIRDELKRRKAKYSGTKDVLIQRLHDYDRNNNFQNPEFQEKEEELTFSWPEDNIYKSVGNSSAVPEIDVVHISQFFLAVYKDNAGLTEYEAVHRKGFSLMPNEFLCALVEVVSLGIFFYKGQVNSEMTKSLTYFVKIAFQPDGKIIQSQCECAAGEAPKAVCKHVAVVCYALLKFKEEGSWCLRKTCTQKKQVWHAPKKTRLNISPKKAEDLNLEVHQYGKTKKVKRHPLYDPRPAKRRSREEFSNEVAMRTVNYGFDSSKRLGISGVLKTASTEGLFNDHDYFDLPLGHIQVLNMIKVSPDQAKEIECKTRKQAKSKLWSTERSYRVTASHVGEICCFTERRDKEKYAENLVSPSPLYHDAVLWGKTKENTAVECYEAMSHNTVQPCGLFTSPEYPFIGGSPDGLVAELTVLEVKCPHSIKDEGISPENYKHLELINNRLNLKKSSPYYYQVQTQMLVTCRQFCDFFVWTNFDEKRIYVDRDDECIENVIIPRVKTFYYEFMVPALRRKYFC